MRRIWSQRGFVVSALTSSGSTVLSVEDYDAIKAAVYMVGGWADGYTNAIFRVASGLRAPFRGLVGPWTHAYPWKARPGSTW